MREESHLRSVLLPIDIATAETATLLCGWLGETPKRVLEIGSGDGHVAEALVRRGHEVVAVDADPELVARARARGVDARLAEWPDFSDAPFDAVAFTRSLHHIDDLDGAVARAAELLAPKGLVIVEDFAFDTLDEAMVGWFRDQLRVIGAAIRLDAPDDSFVSNVLSGCGSAAILATDVHRDLHTWIEMQDALLARFSPVDACSAPYFYRYLVRIAPERPELAAVVAALFEAEVAAISRGWIRPLGRRLVGRRPIK